MTDKTKRIIAREGLVILVCIGLSLGSFLIYNLIPGRSIPFRYFISTLGYKYEMTSEEYRYNFSDEAKVELMKNLAEEYPKDNLPPPGFVPEDLDIKCVGQDCKLIDHIKNACFNFGFVFLLLAYPIYLIIRFIIWAIRTLKGR